MSEQLFVCNKCGNYTPLVQKSDRLPDNVEHHYAECQSCGYRSTFFYTNPKIKALLNKQKNTPFLTKKKERLTKEIKKYMDELRHKIESEEDNHAETKSS